MSTLELSVTSIAGTSLVQEGKAHWERTLHEPRLASSHFYYRPLIVQLSSSKMDQLTLDNKFVQHPFKTALKIKSNKIADVA